MMGKSFEIESLDYLFETIIDTFSENFQSAGYYKHKSYSSLVSSIDHSVRFIGSTTNVFKQYLVGDMPIPEKGYFLVQKCLRTRNTNTLLSDEIFPEWSSYFTAMGIIAPYKNLDLLLIDTLNFLFKLGIESNKIKIHVSSKDKDLLECLDNIQKKVKFLIDIDGIDNINYYRHIYGIQGISGRNFNFAVKNEKTGEFKDIGNIVLIEKSGMPIAVEMGIGVSTLISRIFGLNNSIEASSISKVVPFKPGFTSKFSDALSVSIIMLKEKIKPGSRDKGRLLRINLIALSYFRSKLNLSFEAIEGYANKYEKEEFREITSIGNQIVLYLKDYEENITHPSI